MRYRFYSWLAFTWMLFSVLLAPTASAQSLTAERNMPFLPGWSMGVSQGNNNGGAFSHHSGIPDSVDFARPGAADRGIPVVAVADGYVNIAMEGAADRKQDDEYSDSCGEGYGNHVVYCNGFRLPSDTCEMAGHLREVFVVPGEYVRQGQVIGTMGNNGYSFGVHLHSHLQSVYDAYASVPSEYHYLLDKNDNPTTEHLTATWYEGEYMCSVHDDEDDELDEWCYYSTNEGMMGEYANGLDSADRGDQVDPQTGAAISSQDGLGGYGWYSEYVPCEDEDGNSNTTCSNDDDYRTNAYIRRYNGGNWWGGAVIVYDALSGATEPYVVRSGFLADSSYGWDTLEGPASYLGMPIESERSTSFGSEQFFQWGILRYTTSTDAVTHHDYNQEIDSYRSVGPGVFAPRGARHVYHWDRGASYRFVDAWNRNGGASMLGEPISDNGSDEGVHAWRDAAQVDKRFLIQNFDGGNYGNAAIMYDPWNEKYAGIDMFNAGNTTLPTEGWNRAYVIRSGFWDWYRYSNGIDRLKAPIEDEKPYGNGGSRQRFLCGWLEYNASTDQIVKHIPAEEGQSPPPGCNLAAPDPSDCKAATSSTSQRDYPSDHGGGSADNTIYCSVGPVDTLIEITGPIQDGLFAPVTGSTVYLEYGSNAPTPGWTGYTSGKPKKTWDTDVLSNGDPKTYSMYVGANVDEMNFFMYEPATSDLEWFDLSQWRVVGDCYEDGGLIYRLGLSYPPVEGEITCTLTEDDLIVDITGPTEALLVENYVANPDEIQYGSDTDGWTVPYSSGKPAEPWTGAWTHTIVLDPDTYDFNFYLSDVDGVGGEWFDLVDGDGDGDAWTVNGDCWEDGGTITHDPPPSTIVGTITCDEIGADIHVTISGDIPAGIFGTAPTGSNKYLEYGSNAPTPGWVGYTSGKPKKTWTPTQTSYTLILGTNVNEMNWFLYKSTTGQTNWFDLSKWTVGGDCWQSGGLIYH